MADENKLRERAKQKAREKAKQRLNSLNSGDLSRGLGTKESLSTSPAKTTKAPKAKQSATKKIIEQKTEPQQDAKKTKQKEKLGKIVVDKNTIEQMTTTANEGKVRIKRLIIATLCIIIALIWTFVIVTKLIKPKAPENNCFMYLSGNASSNCNLLLNGEDVNAWKTPGGISPQAKYTEIKIELDLKKEGLYNIRFRVEVYNSGKLVDNFGLVDTTAEYNSKTETDGKRWYTRENVEGKQKVTVMTGITFDDLRTCPQLLGISSDNATIKIFVEIERA